MENQKEATTIIPKVIQELSEEQKQVFGLMREERGQVYSILEEATKIKKCQLKKIIKELKRLDLIETVAFVDPDGDIQGYLGRGWVLTGWGEKMQNYLDEKYF